MADAFLIFGMVVALVVVFVYLNWDISWTFRSQVRAFERARWQVKLPAHSDAWQEFQSEVEARRLMLELTLEHPSAVDRLAALTDQSRLEVAV